MPQNLSGSPWDRVGTNCKILPLVRVIMARLDNDSILSDTPTPMEKCNDFISLIVISSYYYQKINKEVVHKNSISCINFKVITYTQYWVSNTGVYSIQISFFTVELYVLLFEMSIWIND